jgi:glutamate dehydrogenase (NAD(P)+)
MGGIEVDPTALSQDELERMTRRFTLGIQHVLGVYRDIPAPDMNTNAQVMAWMMDAFSQTHGYSPAIVTGKPLDLGGAPGREAATGRGCVIVLEAYCTRHDIDLRSQQIAIQGFGNVGSWAARSLAERGVRVVAASDVHGGVLCRDGLDVAELVRLTSEKRPLSEAMGGTPLSNEELIELDCDVLIPAALGQVIREDNAERVRARVVLEAANYPVTPNADKILGDKGTTVIPDILANAGGVTGSYFEWTQNIQQFTWKEDRFNAELAERLQQAYTQTQAFADERHVPLRQAAYAIGIRRVADAARMRGYI